MRSKQFRIKIAEGEEIIGALEKKLAELDVADGVIVSCVGAMSEFELITIYQNSDKIPPEHFVKKFDRKAELLGVGRVENGKAHLHVSCGLEGGQTLSGHLVGGIVTYFADITVLSEE